MPIVSAMPTFRSALPLAAVVAIFCLSGCGGGKDTPPGKTQTNENEFVDIRDNQKYRKVKIGAHVWMAENLRYKTNGSWCCGDNDSNCLQYGRLYDWNTATGACPVGWRLPSKDEWTELLTTVGTDVGGKKLKSASGWTVRDDGSDGNGTDDYGFSALPGGYRESSGEYFDVGYRGYWWTATAHDNGGPYFRRMHYDYDYAYTHPGDKDYGFSVRCVKN